MANTKTIKTIKKTHTFSDVIKLAKEQEKLLQELKKTQAEAIEYAFRMVGAK